MTWILLGEMEGSWGLGADGWSGDMFVESVLDNMMVVVSDYYACWFLDDCRLLLAVSCGLNWRVIWAHQKTQKKQYF